MIYVYMAVGFGIFCLLALRFAKITREEGDQIFEDELKCRSYPASQFPASSEVQFVRDREDEWI